jgi:glycosyltransferase involved in cell wall biosynthesis
MASVAIANSQSVGHGLAAVGVEKSKIRVIYNGKDINRFERASPVEFHKMYGWLSQSILIGFVGQLSPNKGIEDLVKAAQIVVAKEKNCRFVLIGKSTPLFHHFEQEMRRRIGKNGLSDHVVFTGRLDHIEDAYAGLDLIVVPSRHEDPAPNVAIEAMTSGVPVVATLVGGIPEIIIDGETGFLVDKESPEQIAACILCLVKDAELREKMGRAGRVRARQVFDIKKNARLVEEILLNE